MPKKKPIKIQVANIPDETWNDVCDENCDMLKNTQRTVGFNETILALLRKGRKFTRLMTLLNDEGITLKEALNKIQK